MTSKKLSDVLPPLPSSLKAISSYIQRADELRQKDPVMAYWCTYYAAQLGLDLKSHEIGARDYLFALITLLEEMKKELEGNDAIEHEAAGAAYVENFALKVFALADNEDRRGELSRSTAKKFLAAANFLELLRVFEKSNNAEVNEEKVRYAKWKASEIAKAFREGRQPTRGAARENDGTITPTDRSAGAPPAVLPPEASSANIPFRTPPSTLNQLPDSVEVPQSEIPDSGTWSTVATPGSEAFGPASSVATKLAFASAIDRWNAAIDADASQPISRSQNYLIDQGRGPTGSDTTKKVHFSPSVVGGLSSTDGSPPPSPDVRRREPVGSTPYSNYAPAVQPHSIVSGASSFVRPGPTMAPLPDSSPSGSSHTSPEGSPHQGFRKPSGRPRSGSSPSMDVVPKPGSSLPGTSGASRNSPPRPRRNSLQASASPPPPPAPPVSSISNERRSSVSTRNTLPDSINPNPQSCPIYPPPPVSPNSSSFPTTSTLTSPNLGRTSGSPSLSAMTGLPPASINKPVSSAYVGNYAPKPPSPPTRYIPEASPPFELTPALISKAQKHCRFAISALEYEDAEQARKELRAALALLGNR
ncbi:hypothetical protein ACEPAI_787 [Sanghuangporus weigelae]